MRPFVLFTFFLTLSSVTAFADEKNSASQTRSLFNGKDLTGWELVPGADAKNSKWSIVAAVKLQDNHPDRFEVSSGRGMLLNGEDGRGANLLTKDPHASCALHVEFMIPRGSNSGIYFQGKYELQILDTYHQKDSELTYQSCGGIYKTAPPRKNACKAPGEWQTFDVLFQAPRFDTQGKKISNATFLQVIHNGVVIHENVQVKSPTTAALPGPEVAAGPLMLQGDHGPVVFRNIQIKKLREKP